MHNAIDNSIFQTMNGQAIDRYFVGLQMVAKEAGIEIHDFFKDEGF